MWRSLCVREGMPNLGAISCAMSLRSMFVYLLHVRLWLAYLMLLCIYACNVHTIETILHRLCISIVFIAESGRPFCVYNLIHCRVVKRNTIQNCKTLKQLLHVAQLMHAALFTSVNVISQDPDDTRMTHDFRNNRVALQTRQPRPTAFYYRYTRARMGAK